MNGNLLDTHVFIWYVSGDLSISKKAKRTIEAPNALNYISVGSLWEIAVKISLGKLTLNKPFAAIEEQLNKNGFQLLPVVFEDTLKLTSLPFFHKDPFDRLIIAQGITNNLQIITKDQFFVQYPVKVVW